MVEHGGAWWGMLGGRLEEVGGVPCICSSLHAFVKNQPIPWVGESRMMTGGDPIVASATVNLRLLIDVSPLAILF